MRRLDALWAALLGTPITLAVWAWRTDREHLMLCPRLRRWLHLHHPLGRALFLGAWAWFCGWFAVHLIKGALSAVADLIDT